MNLRSYFKPLISIINIVLDEAAEYLFPTDILAILKKPFNAFKSI